MVLQLQLVELSIVARKECQHLARGSTPSKDGIRRVRLWPASSAFGSEPLEV